MLFLISLYKQLHIFNKIILKLTQPRRNSASRRNFNLDHTQHQLHSVNPIRSLPYSTSVLANLTRSHEASSSFNHTHYQPKSKSIKTLSLTQPHFIIMSFIPDLNHT